MTPHSSVSVLSSEERKVASREVAASAVLHCSHCCSSPSNISNLQRTLERLESVVCKVLHTVSRPFFAIMHTLRWKRLMQPTLAIVMLVRQSVVLLHTQAWISVWPAKTHKSLLLPAVQIHSSAVPALCARIIGSRSHCFVDPTTLILLGGMQLF